MQLTPGTINKNIQLEQLGDVIDYLFIKDDKHLFLKVITLYNGEKFSLGNATINKMEQYSVQGKLIKYGIKIKNGWLQAAKDADIKISISGLDSIPYFSFDYDNSVELLTFFNQEMLKKGYLTNGGTASTFSYTENIIADYLDSAFDVLSDMKKLNLKVKENLNGPIKHTTFEKLIAK